MDLKEFKLGRKKIDILNTLTEIFAILKSDKGNGIGPVACIFTPSFVVYFNRTDVEATMSSTMSTLTVLDATTEYNGTLSANVQGLSASSGGTWRSQHNLKVTVIMTGANEHQSHEWFSRPSNTAIMGSGIFLDAYMI